MESATSALDERCREALDELRAVARSLTLAEATPVRQRLPADEGSGHSPVHTAGSPHEIAEALRRVGARLESGLATLEARVEDELVLFFTATRRRSAEERQLLLGGPRHPATSAATVAPPRAAAGTSSAVAGVRVPHAAAAAALHAWALLQLEAALQATTAARGALYLRASDGSSYLRRVCAIDRDGGRLPGDVSMAAGSTLGTVVAHGVGVNISRPRPAGAGAADASGALSPEPTGDGGSVLHALRVRTAVVLPLALAAGHIAGCIIVADRARGHFDAVDEQSLWAVATSCVEVLRRYGEAPLLQHAAPRDLPDLLASASRLPPAGSASAAMHPELTARPPGGALHAVPAPADVPRPHGRRSVIVRLEDAHHTVGLKELEGGARRELCEEDVLESAAPLLRKVEGLWRRSLDTITGLRAECARWDAELTQRNNRIVELEVQLRALQRQFHRMRGDVSRVKAAVPAQLAMQVGGDAADVRAARAIVDSRRCEQDGGSAPQEPTKPTAHDATPIMATARGAKVARTAATTRLPRLPPPRPPAPDAPLPRAPLTART